MIRKDTLRRHMTLRTLVIAAGILWGVSLQSQTIYKYQQKNADGTDAATLTFFSKSLSQYIPHIIRQYHTGKALHDQLWQLDSTDIEPPFMMLSDWNDDGNAGVSPLPRNLISINIAPMNMTYYTSPAMERYAHLFRHEYTHVVMTDRPSPRDRMWRNMLGTKVSTDSKYPLSCVWSWLTVPRWYAPRWFHEGIACFMETWMSGGMGRALGGYDEMYFRSLIHDNAKLSTVVGLESEGTTKDFQLGTNSYLYGLRFVNYLVLKYGFDRLVQFYNRTPDSHAFFATQFKAVYGKHLRDVWNEWIAYEHEHQKQNMASIREYPLTPTVPLCVKESRGAISLGSASPLVIDDSAHVAYTAVNYPGNFAHIERIDLLTGKRTKLNRINGPMLYQTTYLAYDRKRQRLIWTDRNSDIRGIQTSDGQHLRFQRTSNLVYDNARDLLYGLLSHEGVTHIVCYDSTLQKRSVLYTFKFGVSVTDLDVSHDGSKLAMTTVGTRGEQQLILFNVDDLRNAKFTYTTLYKHDDSNLMQFRFAQDDRTLVGCSYYTGVSNLWEVPVADHTVPEDSVRLLSNVEIGLFAPYKMNDGTIYAFEFTRNGMMPVSLQYKPIDDCNAVEMLGQKAYEANPQIADLATLKEPLPTISFGEVYDSIKVYNPLKEMRFHGAYPDISGFTDRKAWNNVTPVLGYHLTFTDKLGINSLNIAAGISPWSHNKWKNRFHISAEYKYWRWTFNASWNKTDFNDLFGPLRRSRKGYQVGAQYDYSYTLQLPFSWRWGASINTFGDMDALPLYQNVGVDEGTHSMQTLSAYIGASRIRTSLGGIQAEQGYSWQLDGYTYFAKGRFYPTLTFSLNEGVLLPFMRNTSAWLRMAVGQNFGNSGSTLGNEYFGGFRNNYIDRGAAYRYRETSAMPGVAIDAIQAHSFCKATGELNLQPLRFSNLGLLCIYPTYAQLSLFATDLVANPWGKQKFDNFLTLGAQLNIEVVLFKHMKTTWSVGYAHLVGNKPAGTNRNGQLMLSLKLL